jgi:hypothetical protein
MRIKYGGRFGLMKRSVAFVLWLVVAFTVIAGVGCNGKGQPEATANKPPVAIRTPGPVPTPEVPAHMTEAPKKGALPPMLDPAMFGDESVRLAYAAAHEEPELIAQLPCYCHCDRGMGHKSLHSCFEDQHASVCGICMNEAKEAVQMKKAGKSTEEIRAQIVKEFG